MKAHHAAWVLLALGASTALARLCAVSGLIDCFSWARGETCTAVWRCPGPLVAVQWDDHDVQEQIVVQSVPQKDWTYWMEEEGLSNYKQTNVVCVVECSHVVHRHNDVCHSFFGRAQCRATELDAKPTGDACKP